MQSNLTSLGAFCCAVFATAVNQLRLTSFIRRGVGLRLRRGIRVANDNKPESTLI